jgi:hypothetical protein
MIYFAENDVHEDVAAGQVSVVLLPIFQLDCLCKMRLDMVKGKT